MLGPTPPRHTPTLPIPVYSGSIANENAAGGKTLERACQTSVLDCMASEGGHVQNPEDCSNKQPSLAPTDFTFNTKQMMAERG